MLITLAMSPPAKIAITLMAGIMTFYTVVLYAHCLARYRRRMRKALWCQVRTSHASVLAGLRSMATIFTDLPEHPIELSSRAAKIIDSEARVASSLLRFHRRHPTMSRERQARQLKRFVARLHDQESRFGNFRDGVLHAVSDQMQHGVVAPPAPGRSYRAVFTLLRRRPPEILWPSMEAVLSRGVSLRAQDVNGAWHQVPLRFSGGSRATFSRRFLERATALRVVIKHGSGHQETFNYEVQHTLPVKPMQTWQNCFRGIAPTGWLSSAWSSIRTGTAR